MVVGGKPELARVVYGYDQGGYGLHQAGVVPVTDTTSVKSVYVKALGGTF